MMSDNERSLLVALARAATPEDVQRALRDCLREWSNQDEARLSQDLWNFRQQSREIASDSADVKVAR